MQGVVFMPQNPQQGSPPPSNTLDVNMDGSPVPISKEETKENSVNQSNGSDSGIFSTTSNSTLDHMEVLNRTNNSENYDTDNRSDCSSPERKYICPICNTRQTSQHEFTLHIKLHNNESEVHQESEKGYTCRICSKVLSSSSSLDRHVLVHSGERPFHCKHCGDTFTTNGNMHRHMRTHSHKSKNYESDGSTDSTASSGKSIEYNNNKVDLKPKRKVDCDEENIYKKRENCIGEEETQSYKCPVCERTDFDSMLVLDSHLFDNHPDYFPAKCNQCNQYFQNHSQLTNHKVTVHDPSPNKHSVVGFKDLTFIDFSSEKFPHIARYECEKNLHKVSGSLKFQCKKCGRAFPIASSLEFHERECTVGDTDCTLDLSKSNFLQGDIRRTDFFSRLNLQDVSPEKCSVNISPTRSESPTKLRRQLMGKAIGFDGTKDLADIQSIISMTTNGSLLQQLQAQTNEIALTGQKSQIDVCQDLSRNEEEETQDAFAMEFRKMKLRGEFPCRLCTAVFPNLRALKGHNRAHLNGNNNGMYRCNMCPHSSIDKAALIRHMRTHNGDRPYECSLCNYAFTTKANCERHLRNRHAKTTREEVKKSIIYHPSEDPTNDDLNKLSLREDQKKNNLNSSSDLTDISPEKVQTSTPKIPEIRNILPDIVKPDIKSYGKPEYTSMISNLQALKDMTLPKEPTKLISTINDVMRKENLKTLQEFRNLPPGPISPYFPAPYSFPKFNNFPPSLPTSPKIHVKNFDTLKEMYHNSDEESEEHEEDQALDLSKKKIEKEIINPEDDAPQDLTKKSNPVTPTTPQLKMGDIFAHQMLQTQPKIDASAALYAQWALCRNGFSGLPNWPPFPINPILLQSLQASANNPENQEMKERLRYQLCGGTMITDNFSERLKNLQQQALRNPPFGFNGLKMEEINPEIKLESNNFSTPKKPDDMKPLSLNIDPTFGDNLSKMHSPIPPVKQDLLQSPNSVKMVIKNGVLMPKQKQRRYRTERPFTCEHCSARFTLRSNMERHIKQQHPQFWSQRQRGNVGNPGRKPQGLPMKPNYCDLSIPNYEMSKTQEYEETKESINEKLKYAILAQHLRATQFHSSAENKKEEDEDGALVIDENDDKTEDNQRTDSERNKLMEEKSKDLQSKTELKPSKNEENQDLVPISRLLDNASQQQFKEYFKRENEEHEIGIGSEEDEEGLVASGSTSEENISGTDENRSESEAPAPVKKKSAYSLAPNRVSCPYCSRKFPWTSSLRRHILTHTGQKPFKCSHCPLLFTTKSNCDRHLLRKHGNSATTITNDAINNNTNYLMRNVPERPFKCSNCPSSTFSTYSNLKKHMTCKHATNAQGDDIKAQGYEAGSSEDEKIPNSDHKSDWENQISQNRLLPNEPHNIQVQNSDLPFKCHLCDGSFADRQDALDHIKDRHASEYDLLMSKNALDSNATAPEENNHNEEEESEIRGKFPDYSNRKVICAFCMRRFWSAEDLRRHMRTHTGERPFSCDICRRRFTLKHSMLRHRKKHNVHFENDNGVSDEDGNMQSPSFEKLTKGEKIKSEKTDESDGNEGGDLISNLLGIRPSFIDKVLTASADDAAKLLGVKNGAKE